MGFQVDAFQITDETAPSTPLPEDIRAAVVAAGIDAGIIAPEIHALVTE